MKTIINNAIKKLKDLLGSDEWWLIILQEEF
jgi:hypothetical protein